MFIAKTVEREAEGLAARLSEVDPRFDRLDTELAGEDSRLGQMDARLGEVNAKLDRVLESLDQIHRQLQETDYVVRNAGGFNYAKRKVVAVRDAVVRAAHLSRNEPECR